jgi:hypothetical protein
MMKKHKNIKVNKVPITSGIPDNPPDFPKLDNLQLEFLENKDKLRPEYKNESLPDPVEVQRQIKEMTENEPEYEEDEPMGLDLGEDDDEEYDDDGGVYEETVEDWEDGDEVSKSTEGKPPKERQLTHKEQQEKDANDKKEILFQFQVLREAYKNDLDKIPDVDEYMDVSKLRDELYRTRRVLSIDRNAQKAKIVLLVLLGVMEAVGRYFRLPMKGFVKSQYDAIDDYKHLLIEIGLKYASGEESNWPVEIRLFFAVAGSAVMYSVGNAFVNGMESQGTGLGSIISDMLFPGRGSSASSGATPTAPKPMEGPSVSPDDFEDSEEDEEEPPPPPRKTTTRRKINV